MHVEVTDNPATEMSSIGVLKPAARINFRTNPEASQPEAWRLKPEAFCLSAT